MRQRQSIKVQRYENGTSGLFLKMLLLRAKDESRRKWDEHGVNTTAQENHRITRKINAKRQNSCLRRPYK